MHKETEFSPEDRAGWKWTMMIAQPDAVTAELVAEARMETAQKKSLPLLAEARFASFDEGLCAQIMHIGPYAEEAATIARLHAFIAEQGYAAQGKHHEIYLNDPRKTAPDKLQTVLRQPVQKTK